MNNKSSLNVITNPNKRPNNKPNKYKMLIKKIKKFFLTKIFTKKYFISASLIFITGLLLKFIIYHYLGINVLLEYKNKVSIAYTLFMALYCPFIKQLVTEILEGSILKMNAGGPNHPANAGAGAGLGANAPAGANPPAGVGANPPQRAGQINGPIQVNDPNNQNYQYQPNGVNQPLLGNIARSLDYQASIGLTSLSRYTFTPEQESYILQFLLHSHRNVYDNIMLGQVGNPDQPIWWKQSNTKSFRDLLRNAR